MAKCLSPKSRFFWRPISKIHELSYLRNPYLRQFWNFQTNRLKNVGGVGILVIDTSPKWRFEIWPLLWFFGVQSGQFGSNWLIIGSPLDINVNYGQHKFEVHISKNRARIANFQPKIGQDASFAPTFNGHNSVIFYPILTSDHSKMISSSRRIEGVKS